MCNDKQIISERLSRQRMHNLSIDKAVTINDVMYEFSERELPFGIAMFIPTNFDILDPELAKRKYPHEDRPALILSNEDTTVNLAFDSGCLQNRTLNERLQDIQSAIKRLHPSNVFFAANQIVTKSGSCVGCYDFRSHALDGDVYNLSSILYLHNLEIYCWFTCPINWKLEWELLMRQMIETIRIL